MDENTGVSALHAFVQGHVQGVGFRYYVKENADLLHLTGWVRNLYDGSVEFYAEGNRDRLESLLESVRKGPSRSIVTNIQFEWSTGTKKYSRFSFLPTE